MSTDSLPTPHQPVPPGAKMRRPGRNRHTGDPRRRIWLLLFIAVLAGTTILVAGRARQPNGDALSAPTRIAALSSRTRVYWGAYIDGARWGLGNAPWDARTLQRFQLQSGKSVSIVHWGEPWYRNGAPVPFYARDLSSVRHTGAIPMIDWGSWDAANGGAISQPAFTLGNVASGIYDSYIRSWARQAKAWGHPLFLRFDWEMNGNNFPWSESRNQNRPHEYIAAWRHVHDIFTSVGANNVTWVWSPNVVAGRTAPATYSLLAEYYPGSKYVDWTGLSGYNWGNHSRERWQSFTQVFGPTYRTLRAIAPDKPVMISEVGSAEYGGSKAQWIDAAFRSALPSQFPAVKAVVWFDWNAGGWDWSIDSSRAALAAFRSSIRSPYYLTNNFAHLSSTKVPIP